MTFIQRNLQQQWNELHAETEKPMLNAKEPEKKNWLTDNWFYLYIFQRYMKLVSGYRTAIHGTLWAFRGFSGEGDNVLFLFWLVAT